MADFVYYFRLFSVEEHCQRKGEEMFGGPEAVRRIAASALIASTILLCPSASKALDNVTLITDFGYNGRHAFAFVALDRGFYKDAGLDVKIVRGQGAVDAIRQVGAGNATNSLRPSKHLLLLFSGNALPQRIIWCTKSTMNQCLRNQFSM